MNDSLQQMVYVWQELFFDSNFISTTNTNPDYVMLANSFESRQLNVVNQMTLKKPLRNL